MTKLKLLTLKLVLYGAYPFVAVGAAATFVGIGFSLGLYDLLTGRKPTILNGVLIQYNGGGGQDEEMNKADKDYPGLVGMVKARHAEGHDVTIMVGAGSDELAAALREDFPGRERVAVVTTPNNAPRVLVRKEPVPETG